MNKKVLINIFSLLSIQGVGYLIPLLTLPYLVKVLGPYSYGIYGYTLAIIQYSILIVDFGFNLSITKKISIIRDDVELVSKTYWNVMACKLILIVCAFIFSGCWTIADHVFTGEYQYVLIIAFSAVVGNMLFPVWLFQGKEEMAKVAISSITSKILAVPAIFLLIHSPEDVWLVALINGLTFILSGCIALAIVIEKKWIKWYSPTWPEMKLELASAWHIFISTAAINIYTGSITVILGIFTNPTIVGYFTAADKIRLAIQGLIGPVSQALYPRINALMKNNREHAFDVIRKLLKVQGGIAFIISLLLFIYSKELILFLYGSDYHSSIVIMKILSGMPFIIAVSNIFGYQTLLVLNMAKMFSKIVITGGVIAMICIFPAVYSYGALGAAITVLITELVVNQLMMYVIIKNKLPIFCKGTNV
ncbi:MULTISPECIES: flippase [Enterobacteriaceae]|uniref:flippase n=1 Tax=Enterobacteriaceae TaxID=543 RepID=UPI0002D8709C|nr:MULTISPECIES: flippase [Enterobacteriaceae]ELR5224305.1 flippase [Providencia rettgeri]HCR7048812.1 flippase [Shigella flexneri]EFP7227157.1 flippase [Shigella dysenteriae]EFZ2380535.1 flippase [Shigella dysenteriae]EGE2241760.1 flippase [Shigella dysenteriae]